MKNPQKRARKAVHETNGMEYPTDPKQLTQAQKKKYLSNGNEIKMAKGRENFHHAKRSSTKEVSFKTEPEYPHKEGAKWESVKKQQEVLRAKKIDEKLKRKN